ncbi:SDR family oxidoreductase [Acetobacterium wieringae]|uniref:SDR family NAD(P)-dependent oxidoreductase n=1 Tax=Acetobacterium wieringae TaxID=52694 RepID=UPI002B220CB2|nr:SDR family oxidoreductase [Acetobacterium wieringae]MEA4804368.1 SDR family oxidoreductase [Acetobacterium wieringae]
MGKKILLILGASSDVGINIITDTYSSYDLILAHYCNNNQKLLEIKNQLGNRLQLVQADFLDEISVIKMVEFILEQYGNVTHIVHLPAQKIKNEKFKQSNWSNYRNNFEIQVHSIYIILKTFLPSMEKSKYGKVVFLLSSYTINEPPKYLTDYITIKYALLGFMKAIATEYIGKHININAVSPSMIETKFLENIPDLIIEDNANRAPLKRNVKISEVVPMINFLLSDEASYIAGQNIVISGGN